MEKLKPIIFIITLILIAALIAGCPNTGDTDNGNDNGSTPSPIDILNVHFIDVGQGDSILIDLGDTEILIDGGKRTPGVVNYIDNYIDGILEVVIATHPDADHIGGLIEVFQTFTVQQYWSSGDTSTSKTYSDLMTAIPQSCHKVVIGRGDSPTYGELSFNILNPATLSGTNNSDSIVLSLSYEGVDSLLMGDAEQTAELSMLAVGLLTDIDILKVGHHGSHSSSSIQFLNTIQPEIAVYMAGPDNSYGHPHNETMEALCSIGADIYGTDIHGTIIITVDNGGYIIQLENQIPPVDCSVPPLPPVPPTPPPPSLPENTTAQITYMFFDGIVPQVECDEYVEITNLGTDSVNLQGWRLVDIDEGYPELVFPPYISEPGKKIRVYTNENHLEYGGFSFEYGSAVWNNSNSDTAVLYNIQGDEVSKKSY